MVLLYNRHIITGTYLQNYSNAKTLLRVLRALSGFRIFLFLITLNKATEQFGNI